MTNEQLVLLIQAGGDNKSNLEELYLRNRNLIASVANRYKGYADFDDLMQEGYFGLVKAAEYWKESRGAKFSSYALLWIRKYINLYIYTNGNVVKIPTPQRTMINKITRVSEAYYKRYAHSPSIKELAWMLDTSKEVIEAALHDAIFLEIRSTDAVIPYSENELTLGETIKDPEDKFEAVEDEIQNEQLSKVLWEIVDELKPEQSMVLHERFERGCSVENLAGALGINQSHVRYIEKSALKALGKGRNRIRLKPFLNDDIIYSISLNYSSFGSFKNTWTSAPEKAVLLAER